MYVSPLYALISSFGVVGLSVYTVPVTKNSVPTSFAFSGSAYTMSVLSFVTSTMTSVNPWVASALYIFVFSSVFIFSPVVGVHSARNSPAHTRMNTITRSVIKIFFSIPFFFGCSFKNAVSCCFLISAFLFFCFVIVSTL